MSNTNRIEAEAVFERRFTDLGINAGASFYAHEVRQQVEAIKERGKLTAAQYYMVAALVEDVAFRCLGIDPSQPWFKAAQTAQERLRALDATEKPAECERPLAVTTAHPTVDELLTNDRPD